MIDSTLFDTLIQIGEAFGPMKGYPFGGIQVYIGNRLSYFSFRKHMFTAGYCWRFFTAATHCEERFNSEIRLPVKKLGQSD